MIIKRGMKPDALDMKEYVRRTRLVLAKRMKEDFVIETGKGWETCRRGMWLVNIAPDLWMAVEDAQFHKVYRPYNPQRDYTGPYEEEPA